MIIKHLELLQITKGTEEKLKSIYWDKLVKLGKNSEIFGILLGIIHISFPQLHGVVVRRAGRLIVNRRICLFGSLWKAPSLENSILISFEKSHS